MVKLAMKAWCK